MRFATALHSGLKQSSKRRHAICEALKVSGLASQTLKTATLISCNSTAQSIGMENPYPSRIETRVGTLRIPPEESGEDGV